MIRALLLSLVLLAATATLAACGTDDVESLDGTTVDTSALGEGAEELAREAERVEGILEENVRGLEDVRSEDELAERLDTARSELEDARGDLEELELSGDAQQLRDDLRDDVGRLEQELEGVQAQVEEGDLAGALSEVGALEALEDVGRTIDQIQTRAGT